MSRPLRIEYSKACYHVINRGDNRRVVFAGPEDYALFLKKLGSLIHFSEIYCRGRYSSTELSTMLNLSLGGYSSCRRSTGVSPTSAP